jgi:hypothetical protein
MLTGPLTRTESVLSFEKTPLGRRRLMCDQAGFFASNMLN